MKNEGKAPYVVQAWLDAGEGKNKTPFLTTPPLSRLDPGMENILRIMRVSSNELPADRESVFWLNVKEIPRRPKAKTCCRSPCARASSCSTARRRCATATPRSRATA